MGREHHDGNVSFSQFCMWSAHRSDFFNVIFWKNCFANHCKIIQPLLAGLDTPSQQDICLSYSLRGQQRKRNSKYVDFETDDKDIVKRVKQKSSQKSVGKGATSRKTPTKQRKTKTPEQQTTNGEKESPQTIPADSVDTVITPRKPKRPKKTQPAETASAAGDLPTGKTGGSVVENSVQQENGSLKPKRKYVRKKPKEEVRDPPDEKEPDPPAEPEEEVQSGGRRQRGAAKA